MKLQIFLFTCLLNFPASIVAQFPPAAGQEGSTAIHRDSGIFINWAQSAFLQPGPFLFAPDTVMIRQSGYVDAPLGMADNRTTSLGDGGSILLTFDPPLRDGPGHDFAVFENGFSTQGGYFLELAFVEISSNGQSFYRFPAVSLTDTSRQTGTFDLLNPENIHNLAGKYIGGYGTPFDLAELSLITDLDISSISHIKIIDVNGSLADSLASYDSKGNKINDPFPTPFASGGFDLDAIGVIHQKEEITSVNDLSVNQLKIYPNPVNQKQAFNIQPGQNISPEAMVFIYNQQGQLIQHQNFGTGLVSLNPLIVSGSYWVKILSDEFSFVTKMVVW